jgi:hypothetical protein
MTTNDREYIQDEEDTVELVVWEEWVESQPK